MTFIIFPAVMWIKKPYIVVFFVGLLQLYELDDDVKRKEFLDDLFSFMQKRGKTCNGVSLNI